MNKDVKIALGVIAVIILIAIAEQPSASRSVGSDAYKVTQAANQAASSSTPTTTSSDCRHNGIELKGKVQFVDSFPDLKIKFVSSFADIDVQFVSSFPDDCGQWQEVSSFPDFTVQVVDSFPEIEVKKVSSFPGMN